MDKVGAKAMDIGKKGLEQLDAAADRGFGAMNKFLMGVEDDDDFPRYCAIVKQPLSKDDAATLGCPEDLEGQSLALEISKGQIIVVAGHFFSEEEQDRGEDEPSWLVCAIEKSVDAFLMDDPVEAKKTYVKGLVHVDSVMSLHDDLKALQRAALTGTRPRRVAVYPFDRDRAVKKMGGHWPWDKIVDRRPLEMNPGDVMEVIDSQLSPWLHCTNMNTGMVGYCPENYSLDMMDYVDMMKAWEMEILVQFEENRRGRALKNTERPQSPAHGESSRKKEKGDGDSMGAPRQDEMALPDVPGMM
jgi:hypothetical protein